MKKTILLFAMGIAWFAALRPSAVRGCTSWMVFSDLTGNGTNILHKNRDSISRKIVVTLSPEDSPRKWIALGSGGINMGLNGSGLAGIMNSGERSADPPDESRRKNSPGMMRAVLESCDTAAQAAAKLKELTEAGTYSLGRTGSIFLFMDNREGYVCEAISQTVCTVQRCDHGYVVRASNWRNPDMYRHWGNDIRIHLKAEARAFMAVAGLNRILTEHGRIALPEIFALSRHFEMPTGSPLPRSVCGETTCSTASIEIDRQYPETLSTMYVTIGHPRHTVYLPIPVGATRVLPAMKNRKWCNAAFDRLRELKLNAPIPPEWSAFEKESMACYAEARAAARKRLDEGDRAGAVKVLNAAAEKIWRAAAALLGIR